MLFVPSPIVNKHIVAVVDKFRIFTPADEKSLDSAT